MISGGIPPARERPLYSRKRVSDALRMPYSTLYLCCITITRTL